MVVLCIVLCRNAQVLGIAKSAAELVDCTVSDDHKLRRFHNYLCVGPKDPPLDEVKICILQVNYVQVYSSLHAHNL